MLIDAETLSEGSVLRCDATVVGAGAAGIIIALELAKAGLSVNLIESGKPSYSPPVQALADAADLGPNHPPMAECTRRQVGGTSVIWGGRIVPFDPVDFDDRPNMPDGHWPIGYDEVRPYFARACEYLRAGRPEFDTYSVPQIEQKTIVPGLPDGDVLSSTLERWSVMNFGVEYAAVLRKSEKINLVHGLSCTEVEVADLPDGRGKRVACIHARTLAGKRVRLEAPRTILASGGLNTTRLLLASDRTCPGGIGNHSGQLGHFYSGHITGRIARIHFTTPPERTVFGFDRDEGGVYLRRRFSFSRECQRREGLANIVSWLANADVSDASHGNGVLSFAYLSLSSPFGRFLASEAIRKATIKGEQGTTMAHVKNMVRDLPRTAAFIPTFGYKRFLAKRKVPGFFQFSRSNVYTLHYAGEQVPNRDSRVSLADEVDATGLRKLRIDYRYGDADVRNVIRAHELWDAHLRKHDCGRLEYMDRDVEKTIRDHAGDGFHQIGTTRMAASAAEGVVTPDCTVYGFDDLSIASSGTFVTASQANSMFMILAMALRIADRVALERASGK